MFNKKYNPDVINNYNNSNKLRKQTKYQLNNNGYKLIINDKKLKVRTTEDLIIKNNNKNNDDIKINFDKLAKERKIKKTTNNKNNVELKNKFKLNDIDDNDIQDYKDLKTDFNSSFSEQKEEIQQDRNKFNRILESLLDENIL